MMREYIVLYTYIRLFEHKWTCRHCSHKYKKRAHKNTSKNENYRGIDEQFVLKDYAQILFQMTNRRVIYLKVIINLYNNYIY